MSFNEIDIEIICKKTIRTTNDKNLIEEVERFLLGKKLTSNQIIDKFDENSFKILYDNISFIIIGSNPTKDNFDYSLFKKNWFIYNLDECGPLNELEEYNEEVINFATHLVLPSKDIYNLWETLYFNEDIKENLLKYAQTLMEFHRYEIDSNVINYNRVILLHGPPGTGKTSLCKALAQKLTIRLRKHFKSGILIEINSHSLFSKWFSESGKLVMKLFSNILEIVSDSTMLVFLLIDEIESLVHARNQCLSGNEPSDSIRVVNAVLTQIDQIRKHPNVLVLTTSNMTGAIDLAFVDRADIKQYLGLPTFQAIHRIYYSCLQEMIKAKIIEDDQSLIDYDLIDPPNDNGKGDQIINKFVNICKLSDGLSGRTLRKIPFIAYALYYNKNRNLIQFLEAMEEAINVENNDRKHFQT